MTAKEESKTTTKLRNAEQINGREGAGSDLLKNVSH
jgi:hypothetical protein